VIKENKMVGKTSLTFQVYGKHLHYQHFNFGLIENSGDKVT
jgi:hypothetical protein